MDLGNESVSEFVDSWKNTRFHDDDDLDKNSTAGDICDTSSEAADATRTTNNCYYFLFLFVIVVLTIVGNALVCLAVVCQRKLQNMFNYFLVSLAVSDMLSAVLVMPLSIVKETSGYFPTSKLVCVAWYGLDVLFTSSTICHLCIISIDRYIALIQPLRFGHSRRKRHTALKILVVWIISLCIAGPLFILSMLDDQDRMVDYKGCGPETPLFVISATVASFYLPLLIMTVTYALTVRALNNHVLEQRRFAVGKTSARWRRSVNEIVENGAEKRSDCFENHGQEDLFSPEIPERRSSTDSIYAIKKNCQRLPDIANKSWTRRTSNVVAVASGSNSNSSSGEDQLRYGVLTGTTNASDVPRRNRISCLTGSSDFRPRRVYGNQSNIDRARQGRGSLASPDRSKRAVQVLGILFGVFVACYLPFFAVYLLKGTCVKCRPYIPPDLLVGLEWLAYSGSLFNPVIYHIFNQDFRTAFQRLLRCGFTLDRSKDTSHYYRDQRYNGNSRQKSRIEDV